MKSFLCALVLALSFPSFASADLLINGDFEQGDTGQLGTPLPGWSNWGSDGWHHNDAGRIIGTKAMKLWWDTAGLYQDVSILPGSELSYGLAALNATAELTGWNLLLRIEFYDSAVGTAPANMLATDQAKLLAAGNPADQWIPLTDTAVAPATANTARIVINMADWFTGIGGSWNFDNAFITVVPEPTSLCLLGLGGIILMRRRTHR